MPGIEGTIRGYSSVDLIVVDEASRVDDAIYAAVRPMLAVSGGRLLALSTPWGQRGWWADAWQNGGPSWEQVKITAHECPRITEEFLQEEQRSLSPLDYRSEYLCEFVQAAGAVFDQSLIESALDPSVKPLFGGGVSWATS